MNSVEGGDIQAEHSGWQGTEEHPLVVVRVKTVRRRKMNSNVPYDLQLGPVLLNISINSLSRKTLNVVMTFCDDAMMRRHHRQKEALGCYAVNV